ncbi:hypothetical protein NDU88_010474 [Pleurodeles waltl]|uniref:Uncharacterized protein n=1 Tax=Pleurodeles waltl TaxID=8319 RepID=A0AAV7QXH5_PLEWA|nr:hypothetical protein NDU88_010474 [Pleurodeles waltl]
MTIVEGSSDTLFVNLRISVVEEGTDDRALSEYSGIEIEDVSNGGGVGEDVSVTEVDSACFAVILVISEVTILASDKTVVENPVIDPPEVLSDSDILDDVAEMVDVLLSDTTLVEMSTVDSIELLVLKSVDSSAEGLVNVDDDWTAVTDSVWVVRMGKDGGTELETSVPVDMCDCLLELLIIVLKEKVSDVGTIDNSASVDSDNAVIDAMGPKLKVVTSGWVNVSADVKKGVSKGCAVILSSVTVDSDDDIFREEENFVVVA